MPRHRPTALLFQYTCHDLLVSVNITSERDVPTLLPLLKTSTFNRTDTFIQVHPYDRQTQQCLLAWQPTITTIPIPKVADGGPMILYPTYLVTRSFRTNLTSHPLHTRRRPRKTTIIDRGSRVSMEHHRLIMRQEEEEEVETLNKTHTPTTYLYDNTLVREART